MTLPTSTSSSFHVSATLPPLLHVATTDNLAFQPCQSLASSQTPYNNPASDPTHIKPVTSPPNILTTCSTMTTTHSPPQPMPKPTETSFHSKLFHSKLLATLPLPYKPPTAHHVHFLLLPEWHLFDTHCSPRDSPFSLRPYHSSPHDSLSSIHHNYFVGSRPKYFQHLDAKL